MRMNRTPRLSASLCGNSRPRLSGRAWLPCRRYSHKLRGEQPSCARHGQPRAAVATYLIVFGVLLAAISAAAQSRIDCSALDSRILKRIVHYCVYLPAGYDAGAAQTPPQRYPVLYFFHGLGDSEQTLFNSGVWTLLDDLRKQQKMGDFLMVAPEGRRSFYINSADGSVRYNDFFLQEFMPQIERKYRIRPGREGRAISGISMGGYGALRVAFAHPELFSAVSAQSAALITESPQELDAASQTGTPLAGVLAPVFGNPIDVSHWNDNSPFVLAKRNAAGLRRLAIYFNCGQDDNYGFEKGAARLHEQLQKEGVKHEYHAYAGDHSFTYFMSHFDEVMEFHSKAFLSSRDK
jgi:S-formylglutathione hydrolase FrmB